MLLRIGLSIIIQQTQDGKIMSTTTLNWKTFPSGMLLAIKGTSSYTITSNDPNHFMLGRTGVEGLMIELGTFPDLDSAKAAAETDEA
jgi:hypothetical protein